MNNMSDQEKVQLDVTETQSTSASSGGVMGWIKSHKLITAIILIVVLVAIWYFVFKRKKGVKTTTTAATSTPAGSVVGMNTVTKTGGSKFNKSYGS